MQYLGLLFLFVTMQGLSVAELSIRLHRFRKDITDALVVVCKKYVINTQVRSFVYHILQYDYTVLVIYCASKLH